MLYTVDMEIEVEFYETEKGGCQALDFLRAQPKSVRARTGFLISELERQGNELQFPHTDSIEDGILELRVIANRLQFRFLFFFAVGMAVITNAFLKKTKTTPRAEIGKARAARADWLRRRED